jgi:hypothetical protein
VAKAQAEEEMRRLGSLAQELEQRAKQAERRAAEVVQTRQAIARGGAAVLKRLSVQDLRRAVVLSEVLASPVGLRDLEPAWERY